MSTKSELKRKKCAKCGKSMKRVAWYYRDNEYFCGTSCYGKFAEKKKADAAKKAEEAAAAKAAGETTQQ